MRFCLVQILLLMALRSIASGATPDSFPLDTTNSMVVKILDVHDQIQGHYSYVSVIKLHGPELLSGFNLLIAYDSNVMAFVSAELGSALKDSGCNWTYFAKTGDSAANCPGSCSFGLVRLVASAGAPGQATATSCSPLPDTCELAKFTFNITSKRNLDCAHLPLRFYWQNCLDNSFTSIHGDSIHVSRRVFDPDREITALDCQFECHCSGACPYCDTLFGNSKLVRLVDFHNGGIDLVCADSINARGDINLNGIANEIADVRMFADDLLRITNALPHLDSDLSILNFDVNFDGLPLTVADLVYLQRIIIGDALPLARLKPLADTAEVDLSRELFSVRAPVDIAAVLAVFDCDSNCKVEPLTNLVTTDFYDSTVGELRVLVTCDVSLTDTLSGSGCREKRLPAGENRLFSIHGRAKLKEAQVSDYNGNLLLPLSRLTNLPIMFAISSGPLSWPLRGNARIALYLPYKTDWRIDIFDDQHQLILTYQGRDIGHKNVVVEVANFCPGTYTYTVTAGQHTSAGTLIRW